MAATLDDVVNAIDAMSLAVTSAIVTISVDIQAKMDTVAAMMKHDVYAAPDVNVDSDFSKFFMHGRIGQSEDDKRQVDAGAQDPKVKIYQNLLMEFNAHKHLAGGSGALTSPLPATDIYGWTWVYDKPPPMLTSVKKQEGAREDPFTA